VDDAFYLTAGSNTRKAENLKRNPHCVITIAMHDFYPVVEGKARKVTDEARLTHIAGAFAASGLQPTVRNGAFYAEYSAPSAGPPPWRFTKSFPQPFSPWAQPSRMAPPAGDSNRGRMKSEFCTTML
jgi:hypothetical protein